MAETGYDFSQLRVLLVDDSRHIRSLVGSFLAGFGLKDVHFAGDAEAGWAEFKTLDPDLVITDWHMPPTSGLDLVAAIRTDPESPNPYVPVIMLTGFTELMRVQMARDTGVSNFLAKPLSANALYRRLCAVVDDQRPFVRVGRYFGPDRRTGRRDAAYQGQNRRDGTTG